MEQLGLVRKVVDNNAEVEIRRVSGCGGNCSSCSGSCDAPNITVSLKNDINAKEGDLVEIKAISRKILKYTLIVYMIPFIMLTLGIILGVNLFQSMGLQNYEMLGFGVGIVFLAVSFIIVKLIDNFINKKNEVAMEMTRILSR
ncbi:SoxR reducing system RseC family protein [Schnuerera sp. xch1]|uniref:SoxR reducing system RseC family protein n=1 Tax=Schnuerera sp. xch1 TaxID=2874283 RepID=UPI001CBFEA24|nr:SoxR reducing system RseC family protein [Schnuerera sp. xch1]MBZ2173960.1 SoxR reducing system RseC family protein [Schnuerera sp. xch1]